MQLQDSIVLEYIYMQKENIVDPDQLASEKPADLDLHFSQQDLSRFSGTRVIKYYHVILRHILTFGVVLLNFGPSMF